MSVKPSPLYSPAKLADVFMVKAVNLSKLAMCVGSFGTSFAYKADVIFGKLRSRPALSSWESFSRNSIAHILLVRSKFQMLNIHARRIVARVHNHCTFWNRPVNALPHRTVRHLALHIFGSRKCAVAFPVLGTSPLNAATWGFDSLIKKPANDRTKPIIAGGDESASAVAALLFGRGLVKIWHGLVYNQQGVPSQQVAYDY